MRRIPSAAVAASLLCSSASSVDGQDQTPDWKEGAVCYEIFVRSFYDSDNDGVGDLRGLIEKLDHVNDGSPASTRDLGATCIWLMPIAASPSYHGYDVTDYYRVEPAYGTNEDFKRLIAAAHQRGIRVLVDLVLNHASSEHPYFKHALLHPDSPYRDWFRFAPSAGGRNEWGTEVWHSSPVRDEYYYGFFWSGMPDLNLRNPAVREETKRIATFWLRDMGVDGFRLDAIRHLMEEGDQTTNVSANHDFLREFAAHVRSVAPDAFTIGEVYDSIGAVLAYYPDQLDSHFAFEVADSIVSAVRTGSAQGLLAPALRLQRELPAERWSPFLRNHDQTRTMTEFGGDMRRARLAATILLTLPGLPFVYYGEEIGMTGDKPDPRLRTPMHWNRGPAAGFTRGVPWEPLPGDSFTANVEVMDADTASLLHVYRKLIHLRAADAALGSGELVPLETNHPSLVAYLRRTQNRTLFIIANLAESAISDVRIASGAATLAGGTYSVSGLLGAPAGQPMRIDGNGRIDRYAPVQAMGGLQAHLFELTRR
jgi:glycosidase